MLQYKFKLRMISFPDILKYLDNLYGAISDSGSESDRYESIHLNEYSTTIVSSSFGAPLISSLDMVTTE